MTTDPIDTLAERLGIGHAYWDQEGVFRIVPDQTKRALLSVFGIRVASRKDVEWALAELDRRAAASIADPVVVLREDAPKFVTVIVSQENVTGQIRWTLTEEQGSRHAADIAVAQLALSERMALGEKAYERRRLDLPQRLSPGYHALDLVLEGPHGRLTGATTIIVTPERAFWPPVLEQGGRIWGIAVQLYGLRSSRSWGIGDFSDLRELMSWAASAGAAAVGVNPLHALFLDDPDHISPYSPSSRNFLNPLYLDVEAIEDFAACDEAQRLIASPGFQAELTRVREAPLVDYRGVTALKRPVLELLHRSFRRREPADGVRRRAFDEYRLSRNPALERFAVFQALRESLGERETWLRDWRRWPPEYHSPDSADVAEFAREKAEEVEFFIYLQWQAELQLARCAEAARTGGMPIGLYLDLAVGTDAAGGDAWAAPQLVAVGATIGAPPDLWNRNGQNWGLPPLNTAALRQQAFAPFAELLRANMRWAGALRIDHVLGLMRLFWIPEGRSPSEGAYVAYPFDEMVGVVALESWRNQCLVIGEDLGTLPEGFQPAMRRAGLLSYCLLYFERDSQGQFRPPNDYPPDALVSITTHDLPTVWGYWAGVDIEERVRINAYASLEAIENERQARHRDRAALVETLQRTGLLDEACDPNEVPFEAILRFLARTPCRVLMVGLEDLLGVKEQANLPGTLHEHPNWRRRLPVDISGIRQDQRVRRAVGILAEERPLPHGS
ncbi:MAG TPA: 4-alpha-glucanotransferase [Alphaproteobacteria bacterium]